MDYQMDYDRFLGLMIGTAGVILTGTAVIMLLR